MPISPSSSGTISGILREIGGLLRFEQGAFFKAKAYERAAATIENVPDVGRLARDGMLTRLPGIGASLAAVIEQIVASGRSDVLEELRRKYPKGAAELSKILSLPRIRALHDALGVSSLEELALACELGRVRTVRGFGEKSERKLLDRIRTIESRREAVILPEAARQAAALLAHVRRLDAVRDAGIAGSLRRRVETIDELDLVVSSEEPRAVLSHIARAPGIVTLREEGEGRATLLQAGALDARVRVVAPAEFGVALVDATGSIAHVEKLARRAKKMGMTLGAGALRRGRTRVRIATEEDLYSRLGLRFVPPEMREDAGEVEAAASGKLPSDLVRLEDLKGAVHCHTVASDGRGTIEEMARAAEALGLRYLTITDHSRSATYANGLEVDRLRRQADEIARVQERVGVRILHGTESDILQDGSLDYPDDVLERLDVIIASIHRRHRMDADQMTERLVRAMRHPLFKIWGHALGRYVLSRPPIACRVEEVLDAISVAPAAIEVNGDPNRLDLEPRWIREARRRGARFVVSADAHSTAGMRNLAWGVDMARRGWLRKGDVLNTLDADAFAAAVAPAR